MDLLNENVDSIEVELEVELEVVLDFHKEIWESDVYECNNVDGMVLSYIRWYV